MNPKIALLSALIFIRMSLDLSSQYFTVSLFDTTITLSQILGIAVAILGTVILITERERIRPFPLLLPAGIILLWGTFSLSYSIAPKSTAYDLLRVFDLFTIGFFAFISIRTVNDFKKLLVAILVSFAIPISAGIYQYAAGIGFSDENVNIPRIFGTFAHPNTLSLSLFVVFALGMLFLTTFAETKKDRLATIVFLVFSGLTLILTFSRVAWVALFSFFVLLSLWRYRLLLIPLILAPIILLVFSVSVRDRALETFNPTPDSSVVWRQELWKDNIRKAKIDGRQWFGAGLETFPKVSEDLRGIRFGSNEAHNDFVKFFVEGGYVGLAAFSTYLLAIVAVIVRGYRRAEDQRMKTSFGFLAILFLPIILSMLSDNVFKNTPLWWIFFAALGGALGALQGEQKKSKV